MTTLLAVTGLSPAIVTETLYALSRETPSTLPERVVFVTTITGALRLQEQLFTPLPDWGGCTVWEKMRRALGAHDSQLIADEPRLISYPDAASGRQAPLDDIISPLDNHAAAEAIFSAVWDVVRDPDHQLIASIAGGRKTMGALLHAAVSLIGRETDRITHVLLEPPFDTLPHFFFPSQPDVPLISSNGATYSPQDARLHLADIPFVALRNRFKELDDLPGSFLKLRDSLNQKLRHDSERTVAIHICHRTSTLSIDQIKFAVRNRALAILHFVLECNQSQKIPSDQNTAAERFNLWFAKHRTQLAPVDSSRFDESDFRRELNYLRDLLNTAPWSPAKRTLVQAPFTFTFSPNKS